MMLLCQSARRRWRSRCLSRSVLGSPRHTFSAPSVGHTPHFAPEGDSAVSTDLRTLNTAHKMRGFVSAATALTSCFLALVHYMCTHDSPLEPWPVHCCACWAFQVWYADRYIFFVPMVAPIVGGLLGSTSYRILIEIHHPDPIAVDLPQIPAPGVSHPWEVDRHTVVSNHSRLSPQPSGNADGWVAPGSFPRGLMLPQPRSMVNIV